MMIRDETERRPEITLRMPADIKIWFQTEAARNGGSLNSEIIRCLRLRMDAAEPPKKRKAG